MFSGKFINFEQKCIHKVVFTKFDIVEK